MSHIDGKVWQRCCEIITSLNPSIQHANRISVAKIMQAWAFPFAAVDFQIIWQQILTLFGSLIVTLFANFSHYLKKFPHYLTTDSHIGCEFLTLFETEIEYKGV